MGVYSRSDSPWWWLWLETAPLSQRKEKTAIWIGTTADARRDSRKLADQVYAQRMTEIAARIHRLPTARPTIRFDLYADVYIRDTIVHHRGADRERELVGVLRRAFGGALLHTIDRDRVQAWMSVRRGDVSARTVNREVDLLKAMLRDAVPKYIEASPIVGLRRLAIVKPKRRLMSPAEETRLLAVARRDPQDYALIVLGIDTLARMGDLLDLRRSDRLRGNWIYVRDPKGGDPYEVPLSPRAARALNAIATRSEFYFSKFRRATNPRDWRGAVRQRLERLCGEADVPFGKAERGITFHWATRRTGATRLLVKKRQPVTVVQQLGNWKTPDVLLEIYSEAQRSDLRAAVGSFPKRSRQRRKSA